MHRHLTALAASLAVLALGLAGSASAHSTSGGPLGGDYSISINPPATTGGFINAQEWGATSLRGQGQMLLTGSEGSAVCKQSFPSFAVPVDISTSWWQLSLDNGSTWSTISEFGGFGAGATSAVVKETPDGVKAEARAILTYDPIIPGVGCDAGTVLAISNVISWISDATAPVTQIVIPDLPIAVPAQLTLAASDTESNGFAGSGVASTEWAITDGGDPAIGQTVHQGTTVTLPSGAGRSGYVDLAIRSTDKAGNTAPWSTARIHVEPNGIPICLPVTPGICDGGPPPTTPWSGCPTGAVCSGVPGTPGPNGQPGANGQSYVGIEPPKGTPDAPPVAVAFIADEHGQTATLSGEQSYDPDGYIKTWLWRKGSRVLGHRATLTSKFPIGRSRVQLMVTDNGGLKAATFVTVTVTATRDPKTHKLVPKVQPPTKLVVTLPADILFNWDRYDIRPDAARVLTKLRSQVANAKSVLVEGYADSTGSPSYNVGLSHRRADSVTKALRTRDVKFSERWFGESQNPAGECTSLSATWRGCQIERKVVVTITYRPARHS